MLNKRQLDLHIPVVGWLLIAGHAVLALVAVLVFLLLAGVSVAVQDRQATPILAVVASSIALLLGVLALPGLTAGWGLLAHKTWARVLAIVVAGLGLINFPLGTLLSAYALFVLFQDQADDYFGSRATPRAAPQPLPGPEQGA
jgi:hypothetical protein